MIDKGIYTAMDACINRAREGLRVCEDILRFVHHSPLSYEFKELRHRLTGACREFPSGELLSGRDVAADSQKFADTALEMNRADTDSVFSANIHRAMEAVRTLEELSKLFSSSGPGDFQQIRFALYELEKRVMEAQARTDAGFLQKGVLCAVLDPLLIVDGEYAETARRMIDGGAKVIQLNTWGVAPGEMLVAARELAGICNDESVRFIVAGSPDIAVLSGACALFLDEGDIPVGEARRLFTGGAIGVAIHSTDRMNDSRVLEADYICAGPVYNTTGHSGEFITGVGVEFIRRLLSLSTVPVMASGGITPENINELADAGCESFLLRAGLYGEGRIEANCRRYARAIAGRFGGR